MPGSPEDSGKNAKFLVYSTTSKEYQSFLGPLEASIMEVCWNSKNKPLTVREVFELLKVKRAIAYTTVMNTMDRLHDKGLLDRSMKRGKGGIIYVYWPQLGEEEFKSEGVKAVLDSLVENFGDLVAERFIDRIPKDDKIMLALKKRLEDSEKEG